MSERAAARSRVYSLLASALSYPDDEVWPILRDGRLGAALLEAVAATGYAADDRSPAALLPPDGEPEQLRSHYIATFDTGQLGHRCSLHEGDYHAPERRAELLVELRSFYRCFGLSMATSCAGMEDHVTVELEFMHFLAFSQNEAGQDERSHVDAQRDFLDRHLVEWLRHLADQYRNRDFYAGVLQLAAHFVAADLRALCAR